MLKLLQRDKKPKPVIYWTDGEIPAKIFFDILFNKCLDKVGTASVEELEKAFDKIFDEYVERSGNEQIQMWYKKQCEVAKTISIIEAIELILYRICYGELTVNERLELIDALNSIEERHETDYAPAKMVVKFDINKPFFEEVHRVQTVVLGRLRTKLRAEQANEKQQEEAVKYNFEGDLVAIENVMGRSLDDNVTLRKYLEYVKSANRKVMAQRKK